ncbi:MAG TPA: ABC transporter permease subunit [Casimicrobiaceae bacterium]
MRLPTVAHAAECGNAPPPRNGYDLRWQGGCAKNKTAAARIHRNAARMLLRWVTAAYLAYLAVPIALLVVGSFGELWLNTILPTGFTAHWYRDVAADPSFRRAFGASLAVVTLTCAACAAIGLPLAYAVFRAESARVRALARVLYQMPIALPPLVLAFGFILVFSSDTLPWLGSIWLLAAGHVVLALPYFLQTVVADMQRLGLRTLEDAAESLGSAGWQRFAHIVLPALSQSILAGLIIVAALSIGEFQFSNLVAGFLNRTYPVVLLQAFYGATGFACAATVVLLALALLAAIAGSVTAGGATRFKTAVA